MLFSGIRLNISFTESLLQAAFEQSGANSLEALSQNGVNHLELRVLDVNPLTRTGIFTEEIRFMHLLPLYLSSLARFVPYEV